MNRSPVTCLSLSAAAQGSTMRGRDVTSGEASVARAYCSTVEIICQPSINLFRRDREGSDGSTQYSAGTTGASSPRDPAAKRPFTLTPIHYHLCWIPLSRTDNRSSRLPSK